MSQLLPHQLRVLTERLDLNDKITALAAFLDRIDTVVGVPEDEQLRLTRQLAAMEEYSGILAERIEHFSNP